LYIKLKINI